MIYEYKCDLCSHECEIEQSIRDAPAKKCPKCGAVALKRLISGGGFLLKGDGWGRDLYAKQPTKAS